MQVNETLIRNVIQQVLSQLDKNESGKSGCFGVFSDASEAVAAAQDAYIQISKRTVAERAQAIEAIRQVLREGAVELGTMEMTETKIGRLEHKIDKLYGAANTLGVEFMRSEVFSGDHGLAVIEHAPFGVIGAITPVTHSLPTIACNSISMLAGGNTVVFNPHPSGKLIAVEGVRRMNQAIAKAIGIENLICVIDNPTLQTADVIFKHPDVRLIVVTGGAAVAHAALKSGKRAITAGPGNPPVVVDETANLDHAARCIIQGAAYDNNLLCISEKEVFVVDRVFDAMMDAMERAGALRFNATEVAQFTKLGISTVGEGDAKHDVPSREFLGKDAALIAKSVGRHVDPKLELVYGETDEENPFVPVEQMMPFVPFVRARNIDHAIEMAVRAEHGFRHTALIHSHDVNNMTKMGKAVDTTIFVKNGPCTAGLGNGGEGYGSYSIAGPTGEGITTPLTFCRERRCVMVDNLRILGK
ncbi:MAG: aldehyde dehydrogenase EutE [Thermoguttaceae bacterium]|nr:aldehyde dehydrogenase EutE [Thermoguttaceae bacterium]